MEYKVVSGINMLNVRNIQITPQMLSDIAEIDNFKGAWYTKA
jgi:hypothetical protein